MVILCHRQLVILPMGGFHFTIKKGSRYHSPLLIPQGSTCRCRQARRCLNQPLLFLLQVFSIVVFGSIVNEGYVNSHSNTLHCVFNQNDDACNYGITIGVAAFFASMFFFVLDIYFPQISSVKDRKRAVLAELGFSGFWTFLWFVGFCFLANQWQRTSPDELPLNQGADAARAAIAFSFFSIITWAGLTVKALLRYRLGTDMSLFTTENIEGIPDAEPYPGYPTGSGIERADTYQSPPFTESLGSGPKGFQIPTY
ncbi:synaptogyrin-3-like [Polyodon spathula]|uniref:synaptogyrin-3-like n=1 Tax=Polyodon spathula TaxID=7913 RepID=UPI001B7E32EE|nr:synaptogyrin-3-like [Polyodon spathula]